MGWRLLADLVLVLHLAFVLLAALGVLLVRRWHRWVYVHLPVLVYAVVIELVGFRCPLTPLEKSLRRRAGGAGYDGGFVEHYVVPILYPGEWTATTRIAVSVALVASNVVAYWLVWRSRRRTTPVDETPPAELERASA